MFAANHINSLLNMTWLAISSKNEIFLHCSKTNSVGDGKNNISCLDDLTLKKCFMFAYDNFGF